MSNQAKSTSNNPNQNLNQNADAPTAQALQRLSENLNGVKLEMANQVNKVKQLRFYFGLEIINCIHCIHLFVLKLNLVHQQQQQQQQIKCPEVAASPPNCLSTLFFTGIIGVQTLLFLSYFVYK